MSYNDILHYFARQFLEPRSSLCQTRAIAQGDRRRGWEKRGALRAPLTFDLIPEEFVLLLSGRCRLFAQQKNGLMSQ